MPEPRAEGTIGVRISAERRGTADSDVSHARAGLPRDGYGMSGRSTELVEKYFRGAPFPLDGYPGAPAKRAGGSFVLDGAGMRGAAPAWP
jgi:hypothetical protein